MTPTPACIKCGGNGRFCTMNCGPCLTAPARSKKEDMQTCADCDICIACNGTGERTAAQTDDLAINQLTSAMKGKMAAMRDKGRGGWNDRDQCPDGKLAPLLAAAIAKGDPVDVGIYAAMLFARGEKTAAQVAPGGNSFAAGIECAAKWVDRRREDFDTANGIVDWDTGTLEYGIGAHAEAKREYSGELAEIAEGIRALSLVGADSAPVGANR